jgi:hypothetical protein
MMSAVSARLILIAMMLTGCTSVNTDRLRTDLADMLQGDSYVERPITGLTVDELLDVRNDRTLMVAYRDSVSQRQVIDMGQVRRIEHATTGPNDKHLRAGTVIKRTRTHPSIDLYRKLDSTGINRSDAMHAILVLQQGSDLLRIPFWDIDVVVAVRDQSAYKN